MITDTSENQYLDAIADLRSEISELKHDISKLLADCAGPWVACDTDLPKESGIYVVATSTQDVCTLRYSVKHRGWNMLDCDVIRVTEVENVTHWAHLKNILPVIERED